MSRARTFLRDVLDYRALARSPNGVRPLLVLTLVSSVLALDAAVFGPLLPAIVRDLDVRPAAMLSALNLVSFLLIGATLGIAYMLDRVPRARFVGVATIVGGIASLLTSRAGTEWTIAGSRAADAIGGRVGSLPVFSLVADTYPPETRGKAFALSGVLSDLATFAGPLAVGWLVVRTTVDPAHPNWRLPFVIVGAMMVVAGIVALLTLREPVRGYLDRRAAGVPEDVALAADERPSFGQAWRTIWSIQVLRRLFIADIPQAVGARILQTVLVLWLAERYRLDTLGIAALIAAIGAAGLVGGVVAGGVVDRLTRDRPQRVLVFIGLLGIASSLAWIVFAAGPPLWVMYAGGIVFGLLSALLGPARGVVYAQIMPANVRTLGLAVRGLAAIPGLIIFQFVVIEVVDRAGLQPALFLAIPFLFVGALIDLSAAPFFERDMRSAAAGAEAVRRWREGRAEGVSRLLVCRDVQAGYDGVPVLFGVDLEIEEGEIVALLGTNGAGKSTLLRAISASLMAWGGAITFDGREITHVPPAEVARRGIVQMPGGRGVFPGLTVRENLAMASAAPDAVGEALGLFPELEPKLGEAAQALSGGEQQMVALAQAFLARPRLLLIDELSMGLAPAVVERLLDAVRRINDDGVSVVIVEQSLRVALAIAPRAVFMEKGEVLFDGPARELLGRDDLLRAVYVRADARSPRAAAPAAGGPVLRVDGARVAFGGVQALDGIDLEVGAGTIVGLIGPNGAGKTTLLDAISGAVALDAGTVSIDGVDVTGRDPAARARAGAIRRFQDARLVPSLTVEENVLLALDRTLAVRNALSVALGSPQARVAESRARREAARLLGMLGLDALGDRPAGALSTGQRRIVDIACVLATEPSVLLLDEPSTGIAHHEAQALAPLIRRIRAETGCAIVMVEHDMALIAAVADEVVALERGGLLARGEPGEVLADERVARALLGGSAATIERSGELEGAR